MCGDDENGQLALDNTNKSHIPQQILLAHQASLSEGHRKLKTYANIIAINPGLKKHWDRPNPR